MTRAPLHRRVRSALVPLAAGLLFAAAFPALSSATTVADSWATPRTSAHRGGAPWLAPRDAALAMDLRARVDALARESLQALAEKTGPGDTQWFDGATWQYPNATMPTSLGPGVLAAAVYADDGRSDRRLLSLAKRTFDVALRRHFDRRTGVFGDPQAPDTYFFALELASAYADLRPSLDNRTAQRWKDALVRMGSALAPAADTWYVNGNINLGQTELFYRLWSITGDQRWQHVYESSFRFTLKPPQAQWPGFGLHYTRRPSRADCADGAGYLAEKGANAPGYDPAYTTGQVEVASGLYLQSRDLRALCLMNLLTNQLLLRTDSAWQLDALNGSRASFIGQFVSSAPVALALFAGRTDLAPRLERLYTAAYSMYRGNAVQNWSNPAIYYGYGFAIATLHAALSHATHGIALRAPSVAPATPSAPVIKSRSTAGVSLVWSQPGSYDAASYRVLVNGVVTAITGGHEALLPQRTPSGAVITVVACDAWGNLSSPSPALRL